MKLIKKGILFTVNSWQIIMDNRYNPLSYIKEPSMQLYFTMALLTMWSAYFGIVAWAWLEWKNYSIVSSIWIHLSIVIPIFITNLVFKEARQNNAKWLVSWEKNETNI